MTGKNALYERNLTVLILAKIFYASLFLNSVFLLFFLEKGLTESQFFYAQGVMAISVVLSEIPCNYLNDRWQHKWGHMIGAVMLLIAHLLLAFGEGFLTACIFYGILGTSFAFIRGAYGALLYDTLRVLKRTDEHAHYHGLIGAYSRFTMAVCAVASGVIFAYWGENIIWVQLFAIVLLVFTAFYIIEPPREKIEGKGLQLNVLVKAFKATLNHPDMKWIVLMISVIIASQSKAFYVIQPVLSEASLSFVASETSAIMVIFLIGVVSAFSQLFMAFALKKSEHVKERRFGGCNKKFLKFCCALTGGGYFLSGVFHGLWVDVVCLMALFLSSGFAQVAVQHMMHERISSEIRATVTAMRSMVTSGMFFLVTFGFAWMIANIGMQMALIITGIIVGSLAFTGWKLTNYNDEKFEVITVLEK